MFRALTSFAPGKVNFHDAPWEPFVDWAISQGLGPLAGYNLEYRLSGARAPEWARDRLLSIHQGTLNDNVMKLVNFKRSIDSLEGRRVAIIGGAAFAETLYPHVAFRPVIDIHLLLPPKDLDGLTGFLRHAEFKAEEGALANERVLSDGRTMLLLHGQLTGDDTAVLARAQPYKVYGPSMFRLELEDAILVHTVLAARAGYDVPMLEWIDLRELLTGATSTGALYSRPFDVAAIKERCAAWKLERPFYASLKIVETLYPETASAVATLLPELSWPVRELIDRLLVNPVCEVGRTQAFRAEDAVRRALAPA